MRRLRRIARSTGIGSAPGLTDPLAMLPVAIHRLALSTSVSLLALALPLGAIELSTRMELELAGFVQPPAHPGQSPHDLSLAVQPEIYHSFGDGSHSLLLSPFLRVDAADDSRTHVDVRELLYQRVFDRAELRIGIGRVFWGVTESYHLVDVINQTDLVENIDMEDKLGQPLVNLSLIRNWGVLDVFALLGFRDRTYPGRTGRLRSEPTVNTDMATYESAAGRERVDWAARWSHAIGDVDIGVAHFHGTGREPELLPVCQSGGSSLLTLPDVCVLAPHYEIVHRSSLDVQATKGSMLWKLEALRASGEGDSHFAWVAGFEFTWYGVYQTGADVGVLSEHLYDSRGDMTPHPFDNEVFVATRLVFNDEASSELLAGVFIDSEGDGYTVAFEAARRIGDGWKVEMEARGWNGVARIDPMAQLRRDDYVQLVLSRFL